MKRELITILGCVMVLVTACVDETNSTSTAVTTSSNTTAVQQSVIGAIQTAEPSVVAISVTTPNGAGAGSGSIITSAGAVLTNDHVVRGGTAFHVTTITGTYAATLRGEDPADDLAVLQITADRTWSVMAFADSSKAQVGEFVVAIGNPLGVGQSASFGIISALDRTVSEAPDGPANLIPNAIQTSAPINPGNSGGALINLDGALVGIPTLGALNPQLGNVPANSIGFAIPANHAMFIAKQLITTGRVTNTGRAYVGAVTLSVTPRIAADNGLPVTSGAYVNQLVPGGPAEKAGVQVGDIIVQADGQTITNSNDLGAYLVTKVPGDQVTLAINRNGTRVSTRVTLGTLPAQA